MFFDKKIAIDPADGIRAQGVAVPPHIVQITNEAGLAERKVLVAETDSEGEMFFTILRDIQTAAA